MFSFHKPKIYRSINGCCICRAKSSSSRFTDSKRYEIDFEQCFMTNDHRSGEICNACVLLVKRWKKLPAGSNRNWQHVVDARAGPGTKSMYKIKNRSTGERQEPTTILRKKHKHKHKRVSRVIALGSRRPQSPGTLSDDVMFADEGFSDQYPSRTPSPENSDEEDEADEVMDAPPPIAHRRRSPASGFSSFLDLSYWKKTEICCGTIFKGQNGEVMLDTSLLRPCQGCPLAVNHHSSDSDLKQCGLRRQDADSCASSDSGVMTPQREQDASLGRSSPPPPILVAEKPGQLVARPTSLPLSSHQAYSDDEEDAEDEEKEDEDELSLPPFIHRRPEYHHPVLPGSGKPGNLANTVVAAASAVLDLSCPSQKSTSSKQNGGGVCIPMEI